MHNHFYFKIGYRIFISLTGIFPENIQQKIESNSLQALKSQLGGNKGHVRRIYFAVRFICDPQTFLRIRTSSFDQEGPSGDGPLGSS